MKKRTIFLLLLATISLIVGGVGSIIYFQEFHSSVSVLNELPERYERVVDGQYKEVKKEMSEKQVKATLGEPDEIQDNQQMIMDRQEQDEAHPILKKIYDETELEDKMKESTSLKVYYYLIEDDERVAIIFEEGKVIDIDISDNFLSDE